MCIFDVSFLLRSFSKIPTTTSTPMFAGKSLKTCNFFGTACR